MAQENELFRPLARDEAARAASTSSARKVYKHKPSDLSKLDKPGTGQNMPSLRAKQDKPQTDFKEVEAFISDEQAMNIFGSISSKRGKPDAVIPMAKQLEALFNAGLITEETAADYEEFAVPYDELPWVQRVKMREEVEAKAAAEDVKKLKRGGTKTASRPPKASSNKALPLSTWPSEQEDALLDPRSRTKLLEEGIDRSVLVDTSGYSPPVQPTAEDYHKSLKPTATNASATGSKKDNAAAIKICALRAPPRRLHADVTVSMMGLHSTIVPRSLLEDDERARDANSTDPSKAVSTEDNIDAYLAWRTRYYDNQTTLLNYNILVQTSAGLVPRDYDGRGLPEDDPMQTEALRAVDELLGRDEVLEDMIGHEEDVEDPLVWVRTDVKNARKKTLAIVRRSEFNKKKHTLGIWRDGRKSSSPKTSSAGSEVANGINKKSKAKSSSPLQPTRRSARNAGIHFSEASDTGSSNTDTFQPAHLESTLLADSDQPTHDD